MVVIYDQMAPAITKGKKWGIGSIERLVPERWSTVQIPVARAVIQMWVHSGTEFLLEILGAASGDIPVRTRWPKVRLGRGDVWGTLHHLVQMVSQILMPVMGTELRGSGQIADKNGPSVGVSKPIRLHVANYRKPDQIGLESKWWICLGNWNVLRGSDFIMWLDQSCSSGILLACSGLLTWLP